MSSNNNAIKFSTTLIVVKIYDNKASLFPYVRRNLNSTELFNQLSMFVCDGLAKEYVAKIEQLSKNLTEDDKLVINHYQKSQEVYRQINDNVDKLFISLNLFVD